MRRLGQAARRASTLRGVDSVDGIRRRDATRRLPPSSLHLYVEPEGFVRRSLGSSGNRTPSHGSTTSRQPSLPPSRPACLPLSLSLSPLSISLSHLPLLRRLCALAHELAHARSESANAPDVNVGPPLIPRLDAHDRVFGLNPSLPDEAKRAVYVASSSLLCM